MSQEIIDRVSGLTADFDRRVQATPASAWGNQSPCSEWKAVDVVAHVANNFLGLSAALRWQASLVGIGLLVAWVGR